MMYRLLRIAQVFLGFVFCVAGGVACWRLEGCAALGIGVPLIAFGIVLVAGGTFGRPQD